MYLKNKTKKCLPYIFTEYKVKTFWTSVFSLQVHDISHWSILTFTVLTSIRVLSSSDVSDAGKTCSANSLYSGLWVEFSGRPENEIPDSRRALSFPAVIRVVFGDARATAPARCYRAPPLHFTLQVCGEKVKFKMLRKRTWEYWQQDWSKYSLDRGWIYLDDALKSTVSCQWTGK